MVLCQTYLQEVVFENSLNDHETRSIRCHGENPCSFLHPSCTHLLLCWSLTRNSVKQTWTRSGFSTNERVEVQWSWALNRVCEVALIIRSLLRRHEVTIRRFQKSQAWHIQ